MDNLYNAAKLFESLLNIEYKIVLGKKGIKTEFILDFEKQDFFHLIGLQYIKDMPQLKKDRSFIFDNIINGSLTLSQISKSSQYCEIETRIKDFMSFQKIIDSNEIVIKYSKKRSSFSNIDADYFMLTTVNSHKGYIFTSGADNRKGQFCKSFFFNDTVDYSRNQISMTLLYKEKRYKSNDSFIIQYDRLNSDKK